MSYCCFVGSSAGRGAGTGSSAVSGNAHTTCGYKAACLYCGKLVASAILFDALHRIPLCLMLSYLCLLNITGNSSYTGNSSSGTGTGAGATGSGTTG